jgi:hypothetical protein
VSTLLIDLTAPSLGLLAACGRQHKRRPQQSLYYCATHLLLATGLVPLLLLLRVSQGAQRTRNLPDLHGGEALAEVLCELLDKGRVEGVGLVLRDKGGDQVAGVGGKVVLGGWTSLDDSLQQLSSYLA